MNAIITLSYSSLHSFLKYVSVIICESGVEDKSHIHFLLQIILITISLNHPDKFHMIEDQNYHNNREFKDFSNFKELLSSAIKNETCIIMNETLPELLNNILNSDCNKFSI